MRILTTILELDRGSSRSPASPSTQPARLLARGLGIAGSALAASFVVGTLLAVFLASFGLLVSLSASSNRVSLSTSLFALLALFAPTQLPGARSRAGSPRRSCTSTP